MRCEASSQRPFTHLIVVPNTLIENWENELERFWPGVQILTYCGSQEERETIRREVDEESREIKESGDDFYDVVISTYSVWERASHRERCWLNKLPLEYMVLDEVSPKSETNRMTCVVKKLLRSS